MKKTRHTEEQIAFALKQAETGTAVAEVIRADGDLRADVLPLEEGIWRAWSRRSRSCFARRLPTQPSPLSQTCPNIQLKEQ